MTITNMVNSLFSCTLYISIFNACNIRIQSYSLDLISSIFLTPPFDPRHPRSSSLSFSFFFPSPSFSYSCRLQYFNFFSLVPFSLPSPLCSPPLVSRSAWVGRAVGLSAFFLNSLFSRFLSGVKLKKLVSLERFKQQSMPSRSR